LHSITTSEIKCLFAMVNRIKYTPVADIVDYFKNVHKMSGPIKCTSMLTQVAMNLGCPEMANLAYIEGDVPILGLDHFAHAHILCEEPDHSLSMLYGHKAIQLPNPGLRLYSCESLTLQFVQMEEARHSFARPPRIHRQARMEAAQQTTNKPQPHSQEPQWDTGYGVGYTGHREDGSYYLPLPGTLTGTLLWSGTSVMGLTRLSTRWKGSDDSRDGWMTLHTCK
jgi:hypothetical protein